MIKMRAILRNLYQFKKTNNNKNKQKYDKNYNHIELMAFKDHLIIFKYYHGLSFV